MSQIEDSQPPLPFLAKVQGPVPQNFPKFLPKLKPKSTFENLKYARWIS